MTARRWIAAGVTLAVVAAAGGGSCAATPDRTLVAHFSAAVGVHPGSDVRILGVRVGEVVAVQPHGRTVRVQMRYAPDVDLPTGVEALIVPPSVVADRYVQLAPAYHRGPVLPDGAELPPERTAAPMELAEIYQAIDELTRALGPDGADADGALARLVQTGRANLEGQGDRLNEAVDGLSRTATTLADGREDLFGTVADLQQFTTMLAESDDQVREFNGQLAEVAEQLAADSDEMTEALRLLAVALADVSAFVRDNRDELVANVEALVEVTTVLVKQQEALIEVLDVGPLALSNLDLAYNPASGTLDTRDNLTGPHDTAAYLCSVLAGALPEPQVPQECFELAETLPDLPLPDGGLLPATPPSGGNLPAVPTTSRDLTLGGILGGG